MMMNPNTTKGETGKERKVAVKRLNQIQIQKEKKRHKSTFVAALSPLPMNMQKQRKSMKSSGRKALQPRNIFLVPPPDTQFLKKPKAPPRGDGDGDDLPVLTKENVPVPVPVVQSVDASLAEELSAFKKKLERLRDDRERTEKLLELRGGAIDVQMNHLLERGEIQKSLEIQVDRLFRLKELHAYSSKISPIRSLRAKEQEKRKRFSFEPVAAPDAEESGEESSVEREKMAVSVSDLPIDDDDDDDGAIQLAKGRLE